LALGVEPPVERPDPMEPPAELSEPLRAQPVAIAGGAARCVRLAVMLDREHVALRVVGIDDREIDAVGAGADLMSDDPAALGERAGDGRRDRRGRLAGVDDARYARVGDQLAER